MITFKFYCKALLATFVIAASGSAAIGQEGDFETVSSSDGVLKVDGGTIQSRLSRNGCAAGFEAAW